jgi:hypothetical protein
MLTRRILAPATAVLTAAWPPADAARPASQPSHERQMIPMHPMRPHQASQLAASHHAGLHAGARRRHLTRQARAARQAAARTGRARRTIRLLRQAAPPRPPMTA